MAYMSKEELVEWFNKRPTDLEYTCEFKDRNTDETILETKPSSNTQINTCSKTTYKYEVTVSDSYMKQYKDNIEIGMKIELHTNSGRVDTGTVVGVKGNVIVCEVVR